MHRLLSRSCTLSLAAVCILPLSALAADDVPPEALSVKVYSDRYVAAGRQFTDLAALESWARPIPLRTMWIDNCATKSLQPLLAAVERFHGAFAEGIHIRAAAACDRTANADHLATDEAGRGWMP